MTKLLETREGFINLDHVRAIGIRGHYETEKRKYTVIHVVYDNGDEENCQIDAIAGGLDIDDAAAPIIPAAPGYEFIERGFDRDEQLNKEIVLATFSRTPIVAWRIVRSGRIQSAEPICIDEVIPKGEDYGILCPNGCVTRPFDRSFKNVDEWAADIVRQWQEKQPKEDLAARSVYEPV
jgi:hypothetical protein